MTVTQLRYFAKTAELHSITAAAGEFCVSQPAVSNAIHDLEKEYDVTLFIRSGRSLSLTAQGERFLETALSLLQHYDNAERLFRNPNETVPVFRIAMTSSYACLYLAELNEYLSSRKPGYRFCFENLLAAGMLQALQNETLDIACLSVSSEALKGLTVHDSIDYTLSFCASEKLFFSEKDEVSLEEIADIPLALHQKGSSHNRYVRRCFADAGLEPDIRFELNQLDAISRLVRSSAVGAFLSADFFRADPAIRSYRVSHSDFTYPIKIVHKKNTPAVQELVRLILRFFREYGK